MSGEDRNAIRLSIRRGEIVAVNDTGNQQTVDVLGLDGELYQGIYRVQIFGEYSNPPIGSDGIMLFIAGFPNLGVFIAGEQPNLRASNPDLKNLPEGVKVIYNAFGDSIGLFEGRIAIGTPRLTLDLGGAGLVELVGGRLEVDGDIKGLAQVDFTNLPAADPGIPGRLYKSGAFVKISL